MDPIKYDVQPVYEPFQVACYDVGGTDSVRAYNALNRWESKASEVEIFGMSLAVLSNAIN